LIGSSMCVRGGVKLLPGWVTNKLMHLGIAK
jgi:hypothetical protein